MSTSDTSTGHSYAMADLAISQIRSLELPATPRNFEFWYTYASGVMPELNQIVNDAIGNNRPMGGSDLDELYERFFGTRRKGEQIDELGGRLAEEIERVVAMVESASGTASSYSQSLAGVTQNLAGAKDRDQMRQVVADLVRATKQAEATNRALEERLHNSKSEITRLQENLEMVRSESLTDPLTGLANRKSFDQAIVRAIADAEARHEPLSLLMTDIDHFKRFNDTYGHLTGDQVLRLVAMSLKQNLKGLDVAARYGGEEFVVILPQTPMRSAITVAEHIRRAVMAKELMKRSTGEHLGRLTISIGVALYRSGDTPNALIERADQCLYAAKRAGRNVVICETDPQVAPHAEPARVA
jgi:diguanylate cyclase